MTAIAFKIRQATLSDCQPIADLMDLAHQAASGRKRWARQLDLERIEATVRSAFIPNADACMFVVDRDDGLQGLAGSIDCSPSEKVPPWHEVAVWVHPEFWRMRIGGSLLDRVIRWASENEGVYMGLVARIDSGNAASIALVKSRGFWEPAPTQSEGIVRPLPTEGLLPFHLETRAPAVD